MNLNTFSLPTKARPIKFHDFVHDSQEGMKHQVKGVTQAQQGMTLQITILSSGIMYSIGLGVIDPLHRRNEGLKLMKTLSQ
jgi:hypothetical protein